MIYLSILSFLFNLRRRANVLEHIFLSLEYTSTFKQTFANYSRNYKLTTRYMFSSSTAPFVRVNGTSVFSLNTRRLAKSIFISLTLNIATNEKLVGIYSFTERQFICFQLISRDTSDAFKVLARATWFTTGSKCLTNGGDSALNKGGLKVWRKAHVGISRVVTSERKTERQTEEGKKGGRRGEERRGGRVEERQRQRQRTKTFPEQRWEIYRCVSWTRIAQEESGLYPPPPLPYIRGRTYSRKYQRLFTSS